MRLFYLSCLLLVFIISSLYADGQKSKNQPGYFITRSGDTVSCIFYERKWKKQPVAVKIKSGEKDMIIVADSVRGFAIPSLRLEYISKIIGPAKYKNTLQDATTQQDPDFENTRTAFIKVLYRGNFGLYVYYDELNNKHFFTESPDTFIEIFEHYYKSLGDSRRVYDEPLTILNKQFEFVLKILMTPCRSLFSIIENIKLEEDQLIQTFKMYDKCISMKNEN